MYVYKYVYLLVYVYTSVYMNEDIQLHVKMPTYKCNHLCVTIHARANLFKDLKVSLCLIPSVWT